MKSLVFNFPKTKTENVKINRKNIFIASVVIFLAAAALIGYFMVARNGDLSGKINLSATVGKIADVLNNKKAVNVKNGEAAISTSGLAMGEGGIPVSSGKIYEETAESGEGITNLARKALDGYLKEKSINFELTPEHRIYIEDYMQNRTGDYLLKLGQKITFSEDLIVEAIRSSESLNSNQLENLHQYAVQVSSF